MTLDPEKKKKIQKIVRKESFKQDPTGAMHSELSDQTDHLADIKDTLQSPLKVSLDGEQGQKVSNVADFVTGFLQSIKGDKGEIGETGPEGPQGEPGHSPVKGEDYFTDPEIEQVINYAAEQAKPVKGVDYFDGADGRDGRDGVDGKNGKNGKDGVDGKDGKSPDPQEIVSALRKSKSLEITDLKNSEQFTAAIGKLKKMDMSDLRWHGGGASKFTDLTDVPRSYVGQANKVVSVKSDASGLEFTTPGTGSGTVSSFSFTNANGISGTVTNPTTTPNLTLSLSAITPTSVVASGTITGSNLSGTNTGDQTTSGTTNRISVTNGATNPVIDIAATYVGQTSITTLGTIATGTWNGTVITPSYLNIGGLVTAGTNVTITGSGTIGSPYVINSTGGGGGGTPGGSDTQVQFNDAGTFGANAGFTYDKTNKSVSLTQGTITTSQPQLNLTSTWNAGAVAFTGVKLNVTNTASDATSRLADLQVGGSSVFSVDTNGGIYSKNKLFLENDQEIRFRDTSGNYRTVLRVDSAENLFLGRGGQTNIQATVQSSFMIFDGTVSNIVAEFDAAGSGFLGKLNQVVWTTSGRVGILVASPSAKLHLPAVTTAANTAPLKFTLGGTLMTATENGAMEATNSHIYWTDSTGTRYQLDQQSSGSGGLTWTEVTGTSQSMTTKNGYIANNASLVTLTLPTTAALGDVIEVAGKGAGLWSIAQNASQIIHFGNVDTTTGASGSITATNRYDSISLRCIVANLEWVVLGSQGNQTIV